MASIVNKAISMVQYLTGVAGPAGFGSGATAEQVATKYADSVQGKTVIVTGATSGFGKETARVLAAKGAHVYVCARTQAKGDAVVAEIKKETPAAQLAVIEIDLESLESVRKAAAEFKKLKKPIDVLINNAGVMNSPDELRTKDGLEYQFGVNHVAHFLFTELLVDELKAAKNARVVNVSSLAAWLAAPKNGIIFDMDKLKATNSVERYGHSKLANILYTKEFNQRFAAQGIVAYSLHPGTVITGLSRYSVPSYVNETSVFKTISLLLGMKSIEQGAATQVFVAFAPSEILIPGGFYADCKLEKDFEHPKAYDFEMAKKLYDLSVQLTGLKVGK